MILNWIIGIRCYVALPATVGYEIAKKLLGLGIPNLHFPHALGGRNKVLVVVGKTQKYDRGGMPLVNYQLLCAGWLYIY